MGSAAVVRPVESLPMTFRDSEACHRPKLMFTCAFEYRAWIHLIKLSRRYSDPRPLRDARNILCRALLDLGLGIDAAQAEAKAAVRRPVVNVIIDGVKHRGTGADGERFRVAVVDIRDIRVVVVVPATQIQILIELPDL